MFNSNQPKNIHRVPKVFQAPRDEEKSVVPRFIKICIWIVILFLGLGYLIFFSPVFKIKSIEVVGSPSDEVKQKLDALKGKNIFSIPAKPLEDDIIAHNQNYLSVDVFRGIPDTVKVKFQDREAKIIWNTQGQRYLVDKNAILFKELEGSSDLPIIVDTNNLAVTIPEQVASANFIDFVKSANAALNQTNIVVTEFQIKETTFQIDAVTDKNFRIIFDTLRPLSEQMDAFKIVYEKNSSNIKEYIDLRVEGFVYFK